MSDKESDDRRTIVMTLEGVENAVFKANEKFFDKVKSYEAEHDDASVFALVDWIDLSMQMGESPLAANNDWSDNNAVNISKNNDIPSNPKL